MNKLLFIQQDYFAVDRPRFRTETLHAVNTTVHCNNKTNYWILKHFQLLAGCLSFIRREKNHSRPTSLYTLFVQVSHLHMTREIVFQPAINLVQILITENIMRV